MYCLQKYVSIRKSWARLLQQLVNVKTAVGGGLGC